MDREKVTRDALRAMRDGESKTFYTDDAMAIDSARTMAYQMQRILGCRFTASTDFTEMTVTITRLPL